MTRDELMARYTYEPETGVFRFRVDVHAGRNNAFVLGRAGDVAGNFGPTTGYQYISLSGKRIPAHRAAFLYMTGELPPEDVDHINGDKLDNRWCNLRPVTRAQNMQNLRRPHADNETGFLGVERKRGRFAARIAIAGRRVQLGVYDTPEEAHAAYVQAKRDIHRWSTL